MVGLYGSRTAAEVEWHYHEALAFSGRQPASQPHEKWFVSTPAQLRPFRPALINYDYCTALPRSSRITFIPHVSPQHARIQIISAGHVCLENLSVILIYHLNGLFITTSSGAP
jgi:hypothetical protein